MGMYRGLRLVEVRMLAWFELPCGEVQYQLASRCYLYEIVSCHTLFSLI